MDKLKYPNTIIDGLVSRLDFVRIRQAMCALEWTWEDKMVPTTDALEAEARRLLEEVITRPKGGSLSCGGFFAFRHGDDVGIQFVIEEASIYDVD